MQGDVEEQLPAAPTLPQPEGSASATVVPESASQDCGDPDDKLYIITSKTIFRSILRASLLGLYSGFRTC